jgi:hypothetical protein
VLLLPVVAHSRRSRLLLGGAAFFVLLCFEIVKNAALKSRVDFVGQASAFSSVKGERCRDGLENVQGATIRAQQTRLVMVVKPKLV